MKKLMFLAVMMLLGSGLTKAIVFEQYDDHPPFLIWNVANNDRGDPIMIIAGDSPEMYFAFQCKGFTENLFIKATLVINGATITLPVPKELHKMIVVGALSAQKGDRLDIQVPIYFYPIWANQTGELAIMILDQDERVIAAGKSEVKFE